MTKQGLQIHSILTAYDNDTVIKAIEAWIADPQGGAFKEHGYELRDIKPDPDEASVILPWKDKFWVKPKQKKKDHKCNMKTPDCPECGKQTVVQKVCTKSPFYKEGHRTLVYCSDDDCLYYEYTDATINELVRRK